MKTFKKYVLPVIGIILLVGAFACIQYFIWSGLFIMEFDSDNAETLLWAEASIESGSAVSKEFDYSSILIPFGGHLLFVPFVKLFGVRLISARLGFTLYSVLFTGLLLLLFRCLDFDWPETLTAAGGVLLFTIANEGMRDIMWAHCVFYGMGVFYSMLIFVCYTWYRKQTVHSRRGIGFIIFLFAVLLGSINSATIILYTAFPFLCAVTLTALTDMENGFDWKKLRVPAAVFAVLCLGFALNKLVTAGFVTDYADSYLTLAPASEWMTNLGKVPTLWIELFTDLPKESIPALSVDGILLAVHITAAMLVLVLSFFSFGLYRRLSSETARLFIIFYWVSAAAILFLYVFGTISDYSRRLIPAFMYCLIVDCVIIREILRDVSSAAGLRFVMGAAGCFCVLNGILNGVSEIRKPIDLNEWYGEGTVLRTLLNHGLTTGYSANFWYSNALTVITGGQVESRWVRLEDYGVHNPHYQSANRWYTDPREREQTFVIVLEDQYDKHPELREGAVEILRASQYSKFADKDAGFYIYVYDENPIPRFDAQETQPADEGNPETGDGQ